MPDSEKPHQNKIENYYWSSDQYLYYEDYNLPGLKYTPPAIREQYQISLWKVDQYGIVRIKDKYLSLL